MAVASYLLLNDFNMDNQQQIKPCQNVHMVNGLVPTEFDERFADKVCDCGKLVFYKDQCGCPHTPQGWRIKSKPNPNYVQYY